MTDSNPCMCDTGFDAITDILLVDVSTATAYDYIAIGTGTSTPTRTDTTLETEDQRAASTGTQETTQSTNDTLQLVHTFSFGGAKTISEAGIINAAVGGALLSHATFTGISVTASDTLAVTYQILAQQGT